MRLRSARSLLVVVGTAMVIAGFVLPWVHVDTDEPKRFQKILRDIGRITVVIGEGSEQITITSESLEHFPLQIRGHELPGLSTRADVRLALKFLAAATDLPDDLPKRLKALYAVPIGALLLGWLLLWVRPRWFKGLLAVCCLIIAAVGVWTLTTFRPEVTLLKIQFGTGPWIATAGYLVLALVALLPLRVDRPSAKPL